MLSNVTMDVLASCILIVRPNNLPQINLALLVAASCVLQERKKPCVNYPKLAK